MAAKQPSAETAAKQKLRATFGAKTVNTPVVDDDDFVPEVNWLNIGFTDEHGNFISLPLGVPVSKLKHVKVPSTGEYRQIALLRNALITKILAVAAKNQPGNEIELDGLEVRLRTVADQEPTESDEDVALPFAINW